MLDPFQELGENCPICSFPFANTSILSDMLEEMGHVKIGIAPKIGIAQ